jgi:lysophospholipase L1-like esterase
MVRLLLAALLVSSVALALACGSSDSPRASGVVDTSGDSARDTYLTLGDSVAAGSGASRRGSGYAELLFDELARADDGFGRHVNLADPGETSDSFVEDQLPDAIEELESGRVRLVTFAIGANDLLRLLRRCGLALDNPECRSRADRALTALQDNVAASIEELRSADPDVRIVLLDYYNPLANLLPGSDEFAARLNDVLRAAAGDQGLELVPIAPIFEDREASLTRILDGDVHPNDEGHRLIAEAVARWLEEARGQVPALSTG